MGFLFFEKKGGNFMESINIMLKDGKEIKVEKGTSPYEIAKQISGRLAKEAVAAEFNGETIDLNSELDADGELNLFTFDSPEGKNVFTHTGTGCSEALSWNNACNRTRHKGWFLL